MDSPWLAASYRLLVSLPDSLLAVVLRHVPRHALLQLRLACQDVSNRLSWLISCERTRNAIGFEPRLRLQMPVTLSGALGVISSAALRPLRNRSGHMVIEP
jgi:hypothetical protein